MRPRRRAKKTARTEIFDFPDRVLVDTSDYKTNNRPQLKTQLQTLIQQRTKGHADASLALELGIGDGTFLNEIASKNPHTLFIGVELKEERILKALDETDEKNIQNTILVKISAEFLDEIFLEQQIDTIFMNFPDPWPKKRHIKNRMTSGKFLKKYEKILKKNGGFILKTDDKTMFEYSLTQLDDCGIKPTETETSLKNDENNIETSFEKKYRKRGKNIFRIIAKRRRL